MGHRNTHEWLNLHDVQRQSDLSEMGSWCIFTGLKVCFGFALPASGGGPAAQRRAEEPAEQLQRPRPAAPYTRHPGAGNSVTHRQTACCAYSQGITSSNKCPGLGNYI